MAVVNDPPTLDLDANDSSGALGADYRNTFPKAPARSRSPTADAVTDIDSPNLAWLTVTITNLLDGFNEVLSANTGGTSITATYSAGSGVLTLNGADTVANYQQVLRTVRYENLSDAPSTPAADHLRRERRREREQRRHHAGDDRPGERRADGQHRRGLLLGDREQFAVARPGTGISVGDVDAGTSNVAVQLSVISGLLTATPGRPASSSAA